jgi:hypothetical protein
MAFLIITSILAGFMLNTRTASADSPEWQLSIGGLVNNPLNLTVADLTDMPQTTVQATIYCVDVPSRVVDTGNWVGVQLKTLLDQAGVLPSAVKVAFTAADGYTTDLDLESATRENVIVAYEKDGTPLSEILRLVVPGRWGYKWISQLTSIRLVDYDFKGTWESQGYSDEAFISNAIQPSIKPTPGSPTPNETKTTTPPSTSPQPSNSSTTLPPQEAQSSKQLEPKPQTQQSFPIAWVATAIAVIVVIPLLLLAYVKKRRNKSRTQPPSRAAPSGY